MRSTSLRDAQAGQMLLATGVVLLMSLLSMAIGSQICTVPHFIIRQRAGFLLCEHFLQAANNVEPILGFLTIVVV